MNFTHPKGTLELSHRIGTVIDLQSAVHTSIQSDNSRAIRSGDPYLPPDIKSKSSVVEDIFIQTDQGEELHIRLSDQPVSLRAGSNVAILSLGRKKASTHYHVGLVNLDTREHALITSPGTIFMALNLKISEVIPVTLSIILAVLAGLVTESVWAGIGAFFLSVLIITPIAHMLSVGRANNRLLEFVDSYLGQLPSMKDQQVRQTDLCWTLPEGSLA